MADDTPATAGRNPPRQPGEPTYIPPADSAPLAPADEPHTEA